MLKLTANAEVHGVREFRQFVIFVQLYLLCVKRVVLRPVSSFSHIV